MVGWRWVDLSHMRCRAKDPVIVFPFSASKSLEFPGAGRHVLRDEPDDSLPQFRHLACVRWGLSSVKPCMWRRPSGKYNGRTGVTTVT